MALNVIEVKIEVEVERLNKIQLITIKSKLKEVMKEERKRRNRLEN